MERDFLGLSSKKTNDEPKTSVVLRSSSSAMQWSFANKGSAHSQFLSFEAPQDVKSRQTIHDASSFMTISTADKSSQKSLSGVIQKNFNHEKQAGNHYAMSVYPMQHTVGNQLNQIIPISLSTPGSTMKPQPHAGLPILTPISLPPSTKSFLVGTTDLRNASNFSAAPSQLTVFYAGSVNVYHDISPEKAHAIMLLAGNGSSTNDGFLGNQSHIASSIPGGSFSSSNVLTLAKPAAPSRLSPINHSEPSKVASSAQSVMTNFIPAVPVPQARKASLARFFEKRKERMTMASPYSLGKKSPEGGTRGSEGLSLSFNSSSSCPPQAIN